MAELRQAVIIVHGMGEHRPLETLNGFVEAGLPPYQGTKRYFYSRPDRVTKSYEARRYLAPRQPRLGGEPELYAQTEFYEYHWAHLMQGNKLSDIWRSFTRILFRLPPGVPEGLRVIWAIAWAVIILGLIFFVWGPGSRLTIKGTFFESVLTAFVGTGLVAAVVTFVIVTVLGGWITSSFVDVVRYLDTSPRSYAARHDIREGIVDLLTGLHDSGRYSRIIVLAHSLGSYIAYDAIAYLWAQMNDRRVAIPDAGSPSAKVPVGLRELEIAASAVDGGAGTRAAFREAQRDLWRGIREAGSGWLITDLITLGSPMYFADRLYTKNRAEFDLRVARRDFPTCPPQAELESYNNVVSKARLFYSYAIKGEGRRALYHAAPFAVVRWTNMWFPARLRFFGDWFGGPLAHLYGEGIEDIRLEGPGWLWRHFPGVAHTRYFSFPNDISDLSVTKKLRDAMELDSTSWLSLVDVPDTPVPKSAELADQPAIAEAGA